MRNPISVALLIFALQMPAFASQKHSCITPEDALRHINKEVCIAAHVYRVVNASPDIHFLDVCSPQTSDADCHFFIVNFSRDEKSVGDIQTLANRDIHIHGKVRIVEGHAAIVLSSKNQLHGGKEKFHPNPRLLKSFSAENGGNGFSTRNGTMGQYGVHFSHRGK